MERRRQDLGSRSRAAGRRAGRPVRAGRRGRDAAVAGSHAHDLQRRVHADRPDQGAAAGRSAYQGADRVRQQEARHRSAQVPHWHGWHGRFAAGDERGVRTVLRRRSDRDVRAGRVRAKRRAARPVRLRRPAPPGSRHEHQQRPCAARGRPGADCRPDVQVESHESERDSGRARRGLGRLEPRARRPADDAGELPARAVHQGRLPG